MTPADCAEIIWRFARETPESDLDLGWYRALGEIGRRLKVCPNDPPDLATRLDVLAARPDCPCPAALTQAADAVRALASEVTHAG